MDAKDLPIRRLNTILSDPATPMQTPAPHDRVPRRRIVGAGEIAAELGDLERVAIQDPSTADANDRNQGGQTLGATELRFLSFAVRFSAPPARLDVGN